MTAEAAIEFVRSRRPGSVETTDQREAVREFERRFRSGEVHL
jgi:protein-tyrosine phosphatase